MIENDIRPKKLFDELSRLNTLDIKTFFNDVNKKKINCPACGMKGEYSFTKNSFNYDECKNCKTLYLSPRPARKNFESYYTNSKATKYWATTFYKATEKNRRKMLWKPKAKIIRDKINYFSPGTKQILDIGGGYGIFMEEFLKISDLDHLIIEPSKRLSKVCEEKGLKTLVKFLENVEQDDLVSSKKTFVSFELFEHLYDVEDFLKTLFGLMKKNDFFIFTTLSGMGADIRVLWKDANPIIPPMHLNFLNPKSISLLLEKVGFKIAEITTPGKLDIDILNNNIEKIKDKFWVDFLNYSTEDEKKNMQDYLSQNLLSSHMMVICSKV